MQEVLFRKEKHRDQRTSGNYGDIKHRRILTNGIWMHIAEKGQGPLVLLIHGFPELWSSWIHQINQLATQGYHVVAPDMRGYGESDCPKEPSSCTLLHTVGDLIGLLDGLGEEQVKEFIWRHILTSKGVNFHNVP